MLKQIVVYCLLIISTCSRSNCPDEDILPNLHFPEVIFETSQGDIVVELDRQKAPITVNHFLYHLEQGLFNTNLVHRVIKDYVIQTAAFQTDLSEVKGCGPLFNESGNGLKNIKGTIAMARYNDPHSASLSFFFNMNDNSNLDPSSKGWGYAVFGRVTEGIDVLETINQQSVGYNAKLDAPNVPVQSVTIIKASLKQ